MKIYVYQIDDFHYSAGFSKPTCEGKGRIVEEWDISTVEDARYVASHGTRHGDARERVTELAEFARDLIHEAAGLEKPIIVTNEEWELAIDQALEKEREYIRETIKTEVASLPFRKRLKFAFTRKL